MELTSTKIRIFIILFILVVIGLSCYISSKFNQKENFDATGIYLNGTPNWFIKPSYDMKKWFVNVYPDRIQPSCLPYSLTNKYGTDDIGLLNYYGSTYSFWRF